jgi:hypothetical protein
LTALLIVWLSFTLRCARYLLGSRLTILRAVRGLRGDWYRAARH